MSVKEKKQKLPEKLDCLYEKEILPDYQTRLKAIVTKKGKFLNSVRTSVGMEKINAKSNSGKYFVEFASSSTIHGLNHLVAPHRHPIEKFLAVLFIVGALMCLVSLSCIFWDRYQNEATVVVLNIYRETFTVPKPSFIICPVPRIDRKKFPSVIERYKLDNTTETWEFFSFLANVTYDNMHEISNYDKISPDKWLSIIYDLRPNMPENILNDKRPVENWIITERGVCLAFRNYVGIYASYEYWKANNWTIFPVGDDIPVYTYINHGEMESITIPHGVEMYLGNPCEILAYDKPLHLIPLRTMGIGTLEISQLVSEDSMKELRIRQRRCKYSDDGGLTTWPIYTREMCVIECRMQIVQEKCNCRPHFVRPIKGVPICNTQQLHCISQIKDALFLYSTPLPGCKCVNNCDVSIYEVIDIAISGLKHTGPLLDITIFNVAVKFPKMIYRRVLFFGFNDFLAAVGGAAGLFLGASVLSFVEIFYFATLHLCMYAVRIGRKNNDKRTLRSR